MNSLDGTFVTPGTVLILEDNTVTGSGIGRHQNQWIALCSGTLVMESTTDETVAMIESGSPQIPQEGEVIIGRVSRLHSKTAEIEILHIEGRNNPDRTLDCLLYTSPSPRDRG